MSALRGGRPRVVAISRSPAYSPCRHAGNDRAILDATLDELATLGWSARRIDEREAARGVLPSAELYLNMGQGAAAARALLPSETAGVRFFNRPSSVLRCHRQRLIPALLSAGVPFPASVLVHTAHPLGVGARIALAGLGDGPLWLKRGGVHAERAEDVRLLARDGLDAGLRQLAERGIRTAVIQAHLLGPVVKFYGVAGGALFHAYLAEAAAPLPPGRADPEALRALAFRAATRLRLDVFGGDLVLTEAGPVLIDLNDWPSFAPIRERAARAIAGYVHAARPRGALR